MSTPPTTAHENRDEEVVESGDGFPLGAMIGSRYRILGHIGRGGMGEIYRALHVVLRREVALKVIARRWAKRRVIRARFRAEVRRAASIIDDHVVQIYDAGALTDGRPYLVMELLLGDTLAARLEPRDALGLLETLEDADTILLAGEAGSHCLANTVRDIAASFSDPGYVKKMVLLTDATSPVPGFEAYQDAFVRDMTRLGMRLATTRDFLN